jgi:hypothetical protein
MVGTRPYTPSGLAERPGGSVRRHPSQRRRYRIDSDTTSYAGVMRTVVVVVVVVVGGPQR